MTHVNSRLASIAWLLVAAACGSSGGSPADDSDGGGGSGAGTNPDSGSTGGQCKAADGFSFGAPITAADNTWTFVDFPNSKCMNNTATGIGVNLNPKSDKVVIYLEGGGACFNTITCLAVANANGYNSSNFATDATSLPSYSLFNRNDAQNPVKDWNFIYVPYCTGDVHSGSNLAGPSGRAHVGFTNLTHYLERLVPTFPKASQVLLSGSSAGGFGAAYNFDQTARAFSCSDVSLLDDAGIPMADDYLKPCLQQLWRDTWGITATMPPDCAACNPANGGGIVNYMSFIEKKYPKAHLGLLSATQDSTIRLFYGFGYGSDCKETPGTMTGDQFQAGLYDVRDRIISSDPNAKMFAVDGTQHTFLTNAFSATNSSGQNLGTWVTQLVNGDSNWSNVSP